jgi:hypothetical protein
MYRYDLRLDSNELEGEYRVLAVSYREMGVSG